jgi:type IV secretory pathway VirJ component
MGPQIADRLAADGMPVVGVNSLTYFRPRRSRVEVTALIGTAIRRALAFGRANRVALIGQSFGADMVHVGLTGLDPALRAKVAMVALVVPTDTVYFRASPSELFNLGQPDTTALPTARQLNWLPVTCIQGVEERDSLCPMLRQSNVHRVALPGGHPMHRDVDAVHAVLIRAIDAANITGR